jgi:predicted transcriptional regulator
MTTQVVTARLSEALVGKLDTLATMTERSRAWHVAKAVERYVEEELDLHAFIQEGVDSADRGDLVGQAEVEAWFEARRLQHAAE